jgi:PTS system, lactose/cellobiose family IIC component
MSNTRTERIGKGFGKVAGTLQSSKPMSAISQAFMSQMCIMIAGSIFTLIDSIPIAAYQAFLTNTGLKTATSLPIQITTNLISLYLAYSMGSKMAEQYGKEGYSAGLISLASFMLLLPFQVINEYGQTAIPTRYLGAAGMFVAMIVGLVTARIYVLILDRKWYIRMPAGVPPFVERSFSAIVPSIIIFTLILIVRMIFDGTSYGSIFPFIYGLIQQPLSGFAGTSIPSAVFMVFIAHLLWFFGLHGSMIVFSILSPIMAPLAIENLVAFQAGLPIPNMITSGTLMNFYSVMGGSGATIGLVVAMLRAKSKRYKTLGRLGILPGFLGVNEPIIFGTPIILNFKMLVPFVLLPTSFALLGLLGTAAGIFPYHNGISTPLGTPVVVAGFMVGGWRVALFQAVASVVSYFAYLPFFKKIDAEAYEEEQSLEASETESAT